MYVISVQSTNFKFSQMYYSFIFFYFERAKLLKIWWKKENHSGKIIRIQIEIRHKYVSKYHIFTFLRVSLCKSKEKKQTYLSENYIYHWFHFIWWENTAYHTSLFLGWKTNLYRNIKSAGLENSSLRIRYAVHFKNRLTSLSTERHRHKERYPYHICTYALIVTSVGS